MKLLLRASPLLAALAAACNPAMPKPTPNAWTVPVTTPAGAGTPILLSIWGTSDSDVWTVGGIHGAAANTGSSYVLHDDGTGWTPQTTPAKDLLWWVHEFAPDDVWMVGEHGTILHYDGASFTSMTPSPAPAYTLYGIWGASSSELWAVGGEPDVSSVVLHFAAGAWAVAAGAPVLGHAWFKVWGSSASDVYFVGQAGSLAHYSGMKLDGGAPDGGAPEFTMVDVSGAGVDGQQPLLTVAGNGPDNVYAVGGLGNGLAIHYDGTSWAAVPGLPLKFSPGLMGVSVTAAGDVSITGQSGAKFRGSGSTWTDDGEMDPLADLHGTWNLGPDDIFAVGGDFALLNGGVVAHYGQAIKGLK